MGFLPAENQRAEAWDGRQDLLTGNWDVAWTSTWTAGEEKGIAGVLMPWGDPSINT